MQEERLLICDIPTRLYLPDAANGLLLLGHGGGHSKDGDLFVRLSRFYAEQTGLGVVCIDAVDHGERKATAAGSDLPEAWHSSIAPQMVSDWRVVVDRLASVGRPTAYVGFSMGAIFGFPIVASIRTITAAVFVAGGIPSDDWTNDPSLAAGLRSSATKLRHANVLMLNKDDDGLFPRDGVQRLFDATVALSKQLEFWPGNHDQWNSELLARSLTFLAEHTAPHTSVP